MREKWDVACLDLCRGRADAFRVVTLEVIFAGENRSLAGIEEFSLPCRYAGADEALE